jgi:hypothetical protein
MSQQKISCANQQINANQAAVVLLTDPSGVGNPPDITKLIITNTSATATLVTLSDGINNYYYGVPAGGCLIDDGLVSSDIRSTQWTVQTAQSVNSVYISACYD